MVRVRHDPAGLIRPLRERLMAFDPRLDPVALFPRDERQRQMKGPQTLATFSVTVGLVALSLALIGLFGVTAFVVQQRTHELSVRRALGATYADLVTMLCGESLRPVAIGLALGVLLSLAAGEVVRSLLFEVSPRDPLAIACAVMLLIGAASVAVFLPLRRAALSNLAELLKFG
jgi:ABC-type antimicrobial peptide transport system permease subunit